MSDVPMTNPEAVIATHYEPGLGFRSTFTQLDNGDIICNNLLQWWKSMDGGLTWSDRYKVNDVNGDPLADKQRVELVVDDARNYLLATAREFDVIISEPSNPWITGASNLFTKEYFELGRSHLRRHGIFTEGQLNGFIEALLEASTD